MAEEEDFAEAGGVKAAQEGEEGVGRGASVSPDLDRDGRGGEEVVEAGPGIGVAGPLLGGLASRADGSAEADEEAVRGKGEVPAAGTGGKVDAAVMPTYLAHFREGMDGVEDA